MLANCRRVLASLRRTVDALGKLGDLPTPADEPGGRA
jgi:hypothetical protein